MKEYEVLDVVEIGDAGEVIQTPKEVGLDEIGGNLGPSEGLSEED